MGKLVLYMPDGSTRDILLEQERLRIGRRADNDLSLPFPAVSGEHAAIVTILADSFLEDLGSTNGTFVNGKPITKHFLRDRDRIDIGRENLVYYADDSANADPLPPELLNSRNLAQPFESYRTLEADIQAQLDSFPRRNKAKRVVTEREPSLDEEELVDRTKRLQTIVGISTQVEATPESAPAGGASIDTQPKPSFDLFVRVISGPSTGRQLPLAKDEYALGRIGVSVAALRRVDDVVWLVPVEGADGTRRNGQVVPPEGAPLAPGDRFEVAGTELMLLAR